MASPTILGQRLVILQLRSSTGQKNATPDQGYDGRGVTFGGYFFSGSGSLARLTPLLLCGLKCSFLFVLVSYAALQKMA